MKRRNVYLHFLDRELRASVGWNPKEDELLGPLLAGLCLAPGALYCSYAHLWESHPKFPHSFGIIRELVATGMVIATSKHSTVDEFLTAHEALYEHDQSRYPMYFRPRLINQIGAILPGNILAKGATATLVEALPKRAQSSLVSREEADIRAARIIAKSFRFRTHEAVTTAMFTPYANNDREALIRIRRLISSEYTRHYMERCSADILSGIAQLIHYDSLAIEFPYYDATLFLALLSISGVRLSNEVAYQRAIDHLVIQIAQPARAYFLSQWEQLVAGIHRTALAISAEQHVHCPSSLVLNELRQLVAASQPSRSQKFSLNELNGFLGSMLFSAKRGPHAAYFYEEVAVDNPKIVLLVTTDTEYSKVAAQLTVLGMSLSPAHFPKLAAWQCQSLNGYELVVVRCEMGTMDQSGATLTTQDVIRYLKPKYIVMAGIAFGLKPGKQKLGHVLIAKFVKDYETRKITSTASFDRGAMPECSAELLSKARMVEWNRKQLHFGQVISGCKLSNSEKLVRELQESYPEAIGGEMEGSGLCAACQRSQVEWILIKGICDWGKKKEDHFQTRAAAHSIDFCFSMIKLLPPGNG